MDIRNHAVRLTLGDWVNGFPQEFAHFRGELSDLEYSCRVFERLTPVTMLQEFPKVSRSLDGIERTLLEYLKELCKAQAIYKIHQQVNEQKQRRLVSLYQDRLQTSEKLLSYFTGLKLSTAEIKATALKQFEQLLQLKVLELEESTRKIAALEEKIQNLHEQAVNANDLEQELSQKTNLISELQGKLKALELAGERLGSRPLAVAENKAEAGPPVSRQPPPAEGKTVNQQPEDAPEGEQAQARELVSIIRKERGYDIEIPADGWMKKCMDTLYATLGNAIQKLSGDIYSSESRFLLELVQNADDNDYEGGATPLRRPELYVEVNVRKQGGYVLIWNNERGFLPKHVRSICDVGGSTKADATKYVGRKGVGFKSVFKVCDQPHIFSRDFSFCFDATKPLGQIVPTWTPVDTAVGINGRLAQLLSEHASQARFIDGTIIFLPLRANHELLDHEIMEDLTGIDHTLLFLRKLRKLEIRLIQDEASPKPAAASASTGAPQRNHRIITLEETSHNSADKRLSVRSLNHDATAQVTDFNFKVYRKALEIPWALLDKEGVGKIDGFHVGESTELCLAFPLAEAGDLPPMQHVYAFLPITSVGFRFVIQGDFHLVTSRQDVHKNKPFNLWLRDQIPGLFLDAIRRDEDLKKRLHHYLPLPAEIAPGFWRVVADKIWLLLNEEACILTESGALRAPREVLVKAPEFEDLVTNAELFRATGKEFLSPHLDPKLMMEKLGVSRFDVSHLVQCLQDESGVLNVQDKSHTWLARVYDFFERKLNEGLDHFIPTLATLNIFRVSALDSTPSAPRFSHESVESQCFVLFYGCPERVTPDALVGLEVGFLEPETVTATNTRFLQRMGIREAKIEDLIELFLLQHSSSTENKIISAQDLSSGNADLEALRQVVWARLRVVREYFQEYTAGSKDRLRSLRSLLLIPAHDGGFQIGSRLYFGFCRSLMDKRVSEKLNFVDSGYLGLKVGEGNLSWDDFLLNLGVAKAPRLVLGEGDDGRPTWSLSPEFAQLLQIGTSPSPPFILPPERTLTQYCLLFFLSQRGPANRGVCSGNC